MLEGSGVGGAAVGVGCATSVAVGAAARAVGDTGGVGDGPDGVEPAGASVPEGAGEGAEQAAMNPASPTTSARRLGMACYPPPVNVSESRPVDRPDPPSANPPDS